MVRTIISILIAALLLLGACLFEANYIHREFDEFHAVLVTLYEKTDNQTANEEDAKAVRQLWEEKKRHLHVWVPHTDISYVEYWLSEAVGLIYMKRYDEALPKLEVLLEITKNLPGTYSLDPENVF